MCQNSVDQREIYSQTGSKLCKLNMAVCNQNHLQQGNSRQTGTTVHSLLVKMDTISQALWQTPIFIY